MKFVLLVYQGTTPLPGSDRWKALSEAEQKAVYADYAEINKTSGVTPGLPLGGVDVEQVPRFGTSDAYGVPAWSNHMPWTSQPRPPPPGGVAGVATVPVAVWSTWATVPVHAAPPDRVSSNSNVLPAALAAKSPRDCP